MNNHWLSLSLAMALACASTTVLAQGDAETGKEKSATCAGCHGELGNSAVASFPKLAQQHPVYLLKQLQAFKNGNRKDPMMSAMAAGLSEQDMADLAAFYASHKISGNAMPVAAPAEDDDTPADKPAADMATMIRQGGDLYRNGDLGREVSACIACHGATGEGNKPAGFPLLKSQHTDYLIKTLGDFKSGERGNTPENVMRMIAKKMTDEEIKAVAYYISVMQ